MTTTSSPNGDPMTTQTTTSAYPDAAVNKDVLRLLELDEQRKDIDSEQAAIKTRLRTLGTGDHPTECGATVHITPTRRFDPVHAATVIPAAFLPLVETTTVDPKRAKAALPPAIYEQCRVEAGELRVVVT